MPKTMPATPHYLRAAVPARAVGVDRETRILRGYVVAQEGVFKDRRGEFDTDGLKGIVRLGNAATNGLKSRLNHATMSDDGPGKHLGRAKNFRMDKATDARTGKSVSAVRADLHFDRTALEEPPGGGKPLGVYVMDLAESDPDALSSSLVIVPDMQWRVDKKGRPLTDDEGNELPPLWMPKELHSTDIVEVGDAVDGLLSADSLAEALSVGLTPELQQLLRFDNVARLGSQLLDGLFAEQSREVIEARCQAWLSRYLELRFPAPEVIGTPRLDALKLRLREQGLALDKLKGA